MYKVSEQVSNAGLYRCTTCGVTIPMNGGDPLPACPSRCADAIWSFYNEKWSSPPGEVRQTAEAFPAHDLAGDPRQIPVGARLTEVHMGPERLAAFHFDGQVYFGSADELFQKTRTVS